MCAHACFCVWGVCGWGWAQPHLSRCATLLPGRGRWAAAGLGAPCRCVCHATCCSLPCLAAPRWLASLSLEASLRPQAGPGQQVAAERRGPGRPPGQGRPAGPAGGGPPRLRKVGEGIKKEVARVVEAMVRRLEAPERREAADASAAQLTLLGVVRKVRARAHVHMYAGSAAPVAMPCSCQPGCWRRAWPLASVGLALPRTNIIHRTPPSLLLPPVLSRWRRQSGWALTCPLPALLSASQCWMTSWAGWRAPRPPRLPGVWWVGVAGRGWLQPELLRYQHLVASLTA